MKLHEGEAQIRFSLRPIYGASEAAAIASRVLEFLTGLPVAQLRLYRDKELDPQQVAQYNHYLHQLRQQVPLQYVLQEAWFYGLKLFVDRRVLIPRPETEELVHWVIEELQPSGVPGSMDILDICTGSGCIALALKQQLPEIRVEGCDKSNGALEVAHKNADALQLAVRFFACDVMGSCDTLSGKAYDVMVSNPPYISQEEEHTLSAHVRDYEPPEALFVPEGDPLLFYRRIGELAQLHLKPGGRLYLEVHELRAKEVVALLEAQQFKAVGVRMDFQGKERMVRGVKA